VALTAFDARTPKTLAHRGSSAAEALVHPVRASKEREGDARWMGGAADSSSRSFVSRR
jgi:hypothetical protein